MPKTKTKTRKPKKSKHSRLTATRPVAPDDLRVGDGVAVARVTMQLLASEDPPVGQTHNRVLKADFIPRDAGDPLRVVGICLPFILVVNVAKQHTTLDLRQKHLVRLDPEYTRRAFKKLGDKRSRALR